MDFICRQLTGDPMTGQTEILPRNKRAAMRISIVEGLPANSCTVGNWCLDDFIATLGAEGFTVERDSKAVPF